jgi:hypothetical protein
LRVEIGGIYVCPKKLASKTLWPVLKKTYCIIFVKVIEPPRVGNTKIPIVMLLTFLEAIKLKTVKC